MNASDTAKLDAYLGSIRARLLGTGVQEYGDTWKTRPVRELVAEALEECDDIPAWVFLLRERIVRMSEIVSELERRSGPAE